MQVAERIDPVRVWAGTAATIVAILVLGLVFFPAIVYDRFLWRYFWGPVVADAHGAVCAVKSGEVTSLLGSQASCSSATGITAYPGYTLVSEVGYAVTGLMALIGILFWLRRVGIGHERSFFFALIPYMFLGGALRVVEDANDAVPPGVDPAVSFPLNTLIISPLIYFTLFFVVLASLLVSIWLDREEIVDHYAYPLVGIGTIALLVVLAYLGWLAVTTEYVRLFPQITIVTLVGATLITGLVWVGIERYAPSINAGTETMGAVVLWGHIVDGVANVVGIDWEFVLTGGAVPNLVPKHPVNRALIGFGERFPEGLTDVIGTAWPFLVVKIIAAVIVLYIFDERIFEESPRYAILLLVAILAVGLGPGTRDMIRATLGI